MFITREMLPNRVIFINMENTDAIEWWINTIVVTLKVLGFNAITLKQSSKYLLDTTSLNQI